MSTKEDLDVYMATVARLEPELHMIDAPYGVASIAISLKRIADSMQAKAIVDEIPVMTCATCHFHDLGVCRARPPVVAGVERDNGYGAKFIDWEQRLPFVSKSDFCGEWRKKQ